MKKKAKYEGETGNCVGSKIRHRFSCHLSTDKHQYKPGETIYVRGIVLNEFNHRPGSKYFGGEGFRCEVKGPSGDIVYGKNVEFPALQESVFSFQWTIPKNIAGGEYKVSVGKWSYDVDEKIDDREEVKEGEGQEDDCSGSNFVIDVHMKRRLKVEGNTITKTGGSGWE